MESLPDARRRHQILAFHIDRMKVNRLIAPDVNPEELVARTRNFGEAELEYLVTTAQRIAMGRLIVIGNQVEVDPTLMITENDFFHALEHDIEPEFGQNMGRLRQLLVRGIISWSQPVAEILDSRRINLAIEGSNLVSVLLEGPPNSGKTTLAAQIAKNLDFPFIKVCTPDDMVSCDESAKRQSIQKIFEDAYHSQLSCILIDNIERLLDYCPIGSKYSHLILKALLMLLKKQPPSGHKLLILCTSSRRQVLDDFGIFFDIILNVPNLTTPDHLLNILENVELFTEREMEFLRSNLQGRRVSIGIKTFLSLIDMVRQVESNGRVLKFLSKLEKEGDLELCWRLINETLHYWVRINLGKWSYYME